MACATPWFRLTSVRLYIFAFALCIAGFVLSFALRSTAAASVLRVQPTEVLPHFRSIAAGGNVTCGITSSGGVICWGGGRPHSWPIVGLESGVQAIALGVHHACALSEAGSVKCWGRNSTGELGNGTFIDSAAPVDVIGLASGAQSVTVGYSHTCALTISGGVKCWGSNGSGQLGTGTRAKTAVPLDVVGLTSGVSAVTAGGRYIPAYPPYDTPNIYSHTCAVMESGAVKCWGDNSYGQLGQWLYLVQSSSMALDVTGLTSGIQSISAGGAHTCVVTIDGAAKCWGAALDGQLGNPGGWSRWMPDVMIGLETGVLKIAAGGDHSCALLTDGSVKCAGFSPGDGSMRALYAPKQVRGLAGDIQALAAGTNHTCALDSSGAVKCWGGTGIGNFTVGTQSATPVSSPYLNADFSALAAGGAHTCVLVGEVTSTGRAAQCWGDNTWGQLGDYTNISRLLPIEVVTLGSSLQAIAAGGSFTCALTRGGGVKCWGLNTVGQLGNGMEPYTGSSPVNVIGLSSGVAAITAGSEHACALFANGKIMCWGNNWGGQLGDDSTEIRSVPVPVWVKTDAQAVAAGGFYTCALLVDGGVKCWGAGESKVPIPISLGGQATAVAVGDWHACALMATGGVKCWGRNAWGQLGDGTTIDRDEPVDVAGLPSNIVAIGARAARTCALTATGDVHCWGNNDAGALGDGTLTPRLAPVRVQGLEGPAQTITLGGSHSCALVAAPSQLGGSGVTPQIVQCWGNNDAGQLGVNNGWLPVDVIDAGFLGYLPSIVQNSR